MIDASAFEITLGEHRMEQCLENTYSYEAYVADSTHEKISVYVAWIYGLDQVYRLKRSFLKPQMDYCIGSRTYMYFLKNGVYEVGFSRYSKRDGTRLERQRFLMILFDGDRYMYPYEELGEDYIAYAAFCLWMQELGEERAVSMFFGKENSACA